QEKPGAVDELEHMIFVNLNASHRLGFVLRVSVLDLLDDSIPGIDVELIARMTALTQPVGWHVLCAHPQLPILAHEDLLRSNEILIKVLKEAAVGGCAHVEITTQIAIEMVIPPTASLAHLPFEGTEKRTESIT